MSRFSILIGQFALASLLAFAVGSCIPTAAQTIVNQAVSNGPEGDIDPGPCNADGSSALVAGSFSISGYTTIFPAGELFGEIVNNNGVQITITR